MPPGSSCSAHSDQPGVTTSSPLPREARLGLTSTRRLAPIAMRRAKHTQSLESVVLAVTTRDDTVGTPTRVCRTAAVTALSGPPKIALSPFSDPLSMGRTDPRCTLPNRRRPRTAPLSNHRHLKSQGRQASCSVMLRETRHRRAARHAMRCAAAGLDPSVRWAPARAGHATHRSLKAMKTIMLLVSQETGSVEDATSMQRPSALSCVVPALVAVRIEHLAHRPCRRLPTTGADACRLLQP